MGTPVSPQKIAYAKDKMIAADPFSVLTFVAAPAVLTNASSVLALGTNNRLARVADRAHAVTAQLAGASGHEGSAAELAVLLDQGVVVPVKRAPMLRLARNAS